MSLILARATPSLRLRYTALKGNRRTSCSASYPTRSVEEVFIIRPMPGEGREEDQCGTRRAVPAAARWNNTKTITRLSVAMSEPAFQAFASEHYLPEIICKIMIFE